MLLEHCTLEKNKQKSGKVVFGGDQELQGRRVQSVKMCFCSHVLQGGSEKFQKSKSAFVREGDLFLMPKGQIFADIYGKSWIRKNLFFARLSALLAKCRRRKTPCSCMNQRVKEYMHWASEEINKAPKKGGKGKYGKTCVRARKHRLFVEARPMPSRYFFWKGGSTQIWAGKWPLFFLGGGGGFGPKQRNSSVGTLPKIGGKETSPTDIHGVLIGTNC